MLEYYQCGVEMIRRDLLTGHLRPYLERAISLKPCYEANINGGEVAAHVLQETAFEKNYASDKLSGARRLRDAIVLGYQLQRAPGRDIDIAIPEWYVTAENQLGQSSPSSPVDVGGSVFGIEDFEILHEDVQGFPDTVTFLKGLSELGEKHTRWERKAASSLFEKCKEAATNIAN